MIEMLVGLSAARQNSEEPHSTQKPYWTVSVLEYHFTETVDMSNTASGSAAVAAM